MLLSGTRAQKPHQSRTGLTGLGFGGPREDPKIHRNSNVSPGPSQTTKMLPKVTKTAQEGAKMTPKWSQQSMKIDLLDFPGIVAPLKREHHFQWFKASNFGTFLRFFGDWCPGSSKIDKMASCWAHGVKMGPQSYPQGSQKCIKNLTLGSPGTQHGPPVPPSPPKTPTGP